MTVTFSEAVTVTGTPQIDLTIGSTVRQADYESGSTTTQLLFEYAVQVADEDDTDGAAINANGLKLNNGRIFLLKNSVTVNADLAHSALANQSAPQGRRRRPDPHRSGGQERRSWRSTYKERLGRRFEARWPATSP